VRPLRIAVLQHEAATGLGAFAGALSDLGVECETLETTGGAALPDPAGFAGAIALGGSLGANDPSLGEARRWIRNAVLCDVPFLGICLGAQLMARALGGSVEPGHRPEVGVHDLFMTDAARHDPLFAGLPRRLQVFGWHEDSFTPPRQALPLAGSIAYANQAFRWGATAYGLQFHVEVRPDDLRRWAHVPAYMRLLEAVGCDWNALADALRAATPALDEVAHTLIERWWLLAVGAAAVQQRIPA